VRVIAFGYRVFTEIERPPSELVAQLAGIATPDLVDSMQKAGMVDGNIRPIYYPMSRFAGPAVTVSVPTGSYIVKQMALALTRAGDVLVIAARGITHHALLGGNLGKGLQRRGLAGAIVDGAVRDSEEHQAVGFPIHARGLALNAGPKTGPGEVNVPVAFGNCVIFPGDIVVADAEGIAVVPPVHAEEILRRVAALKERHARSQPFHERGEIPNVSAVRKELEDTGCEFISRTWGG
jgi:RraA family protein